MPTTARKHFDEDIARAVAIRHLAETTHNGAATLTGPTKAGQTAIAEDLARLAVAFAVAAMDAYLCDAFTDTLARSLKVSRQKGKALHKDYAELELPIGPLMAEYTARQNWSLRMAARKMMERDNLLQLGRLKDLFNPALPAGHKLWADLAQRFVGLDRKRLTHYSKAEYAQLTGDKKSKGPARVGNAVLTRMGEIVKRRHDVIHNCDRPKSAIQKMTPASAQKMVVDVRDFVEILDTHLDVHRLD